MGPGRHLRLIYPCPLTDSEVIHLEILQPLRVLVYDGGDGVGQRRAFEGAEDGLAGRSRRLAGVGGARRRAVARAELPGERHVRRVVVLAPQPFQDLVRFLRRRDPLHESEEARSFLPHFAAARAGRHAPRVVVFGHPESVAS